MSDRNTILGSEGTEDWLADQTITEPTLETGYGILYNPTTKVFTFDDTAGGGVADMGDSSAGPSVTAYLSMGVMSSTFTLEDALAIQFDFDNVNGSALTAFFGVSLVPNAVAANKTNLANTIISSLGAPIPYGTDMSAITAYYTLQTSPPALFLTHGSDITSTVQHGDLSDGVTSSITNKITIGSDGTTVAVVGDTGDGGSNYNQLYSNFPITNLSTTYTGEYTLVVFALHTNGDGAGYPTAVEGGTDSMTLNWNATDTAVAYDATAYYEGGVQVSHASTIGGSQASYDTYINDDGDLNDIKGVSNPALPSADIFRAVAAGAPFAPYQAYGTTINPDSIYENNGGVLSEITGVNVQENLDQAVTDLTSLTESAALAGTHILYTPTVADTEAAYGATANDSSSYKANSFEEALTKSKAAGRLPIVIDSNYTSVMSVSDNLVPRIKYDATTYGTATHPYDMTNIVVYSKDAWVNRGAGMLDSFDDLEQIIAVDKGIQIVYGDEYATNFQNLGVSHTDDDEADNSRVFGFIGFSLQRTEYIIPNETATGSTTATAYPDSLIKIFPNQSSSANNKNKFIMWTDFLQSTGDGAIGTDKPYVFDFVEVETATTGKAEVELSFKANDFYHLGYSQIYIRDNHPSSVFSLTTTIITSIENWSLNKGSPFNNITSGADTSIWGSEVDVNINTTGNPRTDNKYAFDAVGRTGIHVISTIPMDESTTSTGCNTIEKYGTGRVHIDAISRVFSHSGGTRVDDLPININSYCDRMDSGVTWDTSLDDRTKYWIVETHNSNKAFDPTIPIVESQTVPTEIVSDFSANFFELQSWATVSSTASIGQKYVWKGSRGQGFNYGDIIVKKVDSTWEVVGSEYDNLDDLQAKCIELLPSVASLNQWDQTTGTIAEIVSYSLLDTSGSPQTHDADLYNTVTRSLQNSNISDARLSGLASTITISNDQLLALSAGGTHTAVLVEFEVKFEDNTSDDGTPIDGMLEAEVRVGFGLDPTATDVGHEHFDKLDDIVYYDLLANTITSQQQESVTTDIPVSALVAPKTGDVITFVITGANADQLIIYKNNVRVHTAATIDLSVRNFTGSTPFYAMIEMEGDETGTQMVANFGLTPFKYKHTIADPTSLDTISYGWTDAAHMDDRLSVFQNLNDVNPHDVQVNDLIVDGVISNSSTLHTVPTGTGTQGSSTLPAVTYNVLFSGDANDNGVTLPAVNAGVEMVVMNGSPTYSCVVFATGSDTISKDGGAPAASFTLSPLESVRLVFDGSVWGDSYTAARFSNQIFNDLTSTGLVSESMGVHTVSGSTVKDGDPLPATNTVQISGGTSDADAVTMPAGKAGQTVTMMNVRNYDLVVFATGTDTMSHGDVTGGASITLKPLEAAKFQFDTGNSWSTSWDAIRFSDVVFRDLELTRLLQTSSNAAVSASTTQTAVGGTPIVDNFNIVIISTDDDDAVTMPPAKKGRTVEIINANPSFGIQIFPEGTEDFSINGVSLGAGTSINISKGAINEGDKGGGNWLVFKCTADGTWTQFYAVGQNVLTGSDVTFGDLKLRGGVRFSRNDSVSASATQTQVGGTEISSTYNIVDVCTTANDAVTLPSTEIVNDVNGGGNYVVITNNGAEVLQVFCDSGSNIDGGSLNGSVTIAVGQTKQFIALNDTDWITLFDQKVNTDSDVTFNNITVTGTVDGIDIATDVAANTAKVSNVTTDLTFSRNATTVTIESSDGTDAVIPEADTTNAGMLGSDKWDEIVANTAKVSNVTTDLSIGTKTGTTVDVNSSDGTNATLPAVTSTEAGLLIAADKVKIDFIGSVSRTVSAAGVDDTDTTALTSQINELTTVAAGTGVELPAAEAGKRVFIRNDGANAVLVYATTGDSIDGQTVTTGSVSLATSTGQWYVALDGTDWISE